MCVDVPVAPVADSEQVVEPVRVVAATSGDVVDLLATENAFGCGDRFAAALCALPHLGATCRVHGVTLAAAVGYRSQDFCSQPLTGVPTP